MIRRFAFLLILLLLAGCNMSYSYSYTGDSSVPQATSTAAQIASSAVTFTVRADIGWQDTHVQIREGDRVTITHVEGQWTQQRGKMPLHDAADLNGFTCGRSDCVEIYPDAPQGALVARVGTQTVLIGNKATFTAVMTRGLSLRINDGDPGLGDNDGAIQVSIVVETLAR